MVVEREGRETIEAQEVARITSSLVNKTPRGPRKCIKSMQRAVPLETREREARKL